MGCSQVPVELIREVPVELQREVQRFEETAPGPSDSMELIKVVPSAPSAARKSWEPHTTFEPDTWGGHDGGNESLRDGALSAKMRGKLNAGARTPATQTGWVGSQSSTKTTSRHDASAFSGLHISSKPITGPGFRGGKR